ncbi:MAG: FecR domain-containing protein [Bythopirellula sp.]
MSKRSRITEEQERQIVSLLDGQLSYTDSKRLTDQMAGDEELRIAYIRFLQMHAMLKWRHGSGSYAEYDEVDPIAIAELLADAELATQREEAMEAAEQSRLESEKRELRRRIEQLELRSRRRPEPIVIPYSVVYMGAAALAASLLWIAYTFFPAADPKIAEVDPPAVSKVDPPPVLVATVVDSSGAQWSEPAISSDPGTRLPSSQLVLDKGLVQVRLDDGAEVLIEAPANVELISASRVRLRSGQLVGTVPAEAIGFTVETPSATIVDLGTEFGVQVAHGDDVQVHVFNGEVTATAGEDSDAHSILEGEAVHIDGETQEITRQDIDASQFVRKLQAAVKYVGMHEGVGEHIRTSNVNKPLDADGDNVFGTSGYYFFNSNDAPKTVDYVSPFENMVVQKPVFVAIRPGFHNGIAAAEGVYSVHGMPGYLDIDDPRLDAGAEVSNINSGLLSYDCNEGEAKGPGNLQGARGGSEIELCRILMGEGIPASGFRLGLFTDNGDIVDTVSRSIRLTIDGAEVRTQVESNDLNGDIYFFDIEYAKPGDILRVHLTIESQYNFASIGGITFDALAQ